MKGARTARTASDYFIAGRSIPLWVFVLAATATSFSGWTFVGHPGLIYRDGFQYAYASFYAITIPFTGLVFLKRQWMLGKRFGYVTPGEMYADYFSSDLMRLLTVLVALVYSVPYLGVQLRASGFLFNVLTNELFPVWLGMWLLSLVVIIYVASGGLRAVAYVDTMQCILLALGMVSIGLITLSYVGGFGALNEGIARLAEVDTKRTPAGYSHYVAIPGIIQFVKSGPSAVGGAWTGIMILTYMFALMGIQSAPAFSMWSFSNRNPRPFAPQQVWASAFGIGFIMIIFLAIQGMGAHLLGADKAMLDAGFANDVLKLGRDIMDMPGKQGFLVPVLIRLMSDVAPWLVGLLAVCALAAMQSTGAAYMSTAAGMLTRDLYKRFISPDASHDAQKLLGRVGVVVITILALIVATTSQDALVLLGGLAVAYGFQMWPALIATCWWPWLTRQGVTVGAHRRHHCGDAHRVDRPAVVRHHRVGPLAADHPLGGLGPDFQPRPGHPDFVRHAEPRGHRAPHALPRLPERARRLARGQETPDSLGLGHHDRLVLLRHRAGRRHRQHDFRQPERRHHMGLRHPLHLGLAHSVVGAGGRHDVVPGLQDADVHGAGAGGRGAGGRHWRREGFGGDGGLGP